MYEARLYYYANTNTYELQNMVEAILAQGSSIDEIRFLMAQKGLKVEKGATTKDQFGMRYAKCLVLTNAEYEGAEPMMGEDAQGTLVPAISLDELACCDRIERHYYKGQKVF